MWKKTEQERLLGQAKIEYREWLFLLERKVPDLMFEEWELELQ